MIAALRRHPIFTGFAAITAAATAILTPFVGGWTALLLGFDIGALAFLALMARQFSGDDEGRMRDRAAANEPDNATLITLALLIVVIVIAALIQELRHSSTGNSFGVALGATTLALAWVFTNAMFTLHYAHLYYLPKPGTASDGHRHDLGGLDFPKGNPTPDYWDFAYFAFVLGMTFQVSDVTISSRRIRRLALFHAMLAFVFNIAVIALSVSLVASVVAAPPPTADAAAATGNN